MSTAKSNKELTQVFYVSATLLLLCLSIINIHNYLKPEKVLGANVEVPVEETFDTKKYWEELVSKNPTYYDGWIELYHINMKEGNFKEAVNAYQIAKRIDFNR